MTPKPGSETLTNPDAALGAWVQRSLALMAAVAVQRGTSVLPAWWEAGVANIHTQGESTVDPVDAWLAFRLRLPLPSAGVPDVIRTISKGWQLYGSGCWFEARLAFEEAWNCLLPWWLAHRPCAELAEAALGLGCTWLRSGRLAYSHEWLLVSLHLARVARDDWVSIQAYGAVGECLLRGGYPSLAFHAFSSAYGLLPPGSGQRARQLIYLGVAASRLGQVSRAWAALTVALQLARDAGDLVSEAHARVRLLFMGLRHASLSDDAASLVRGETLWGTTSRGVEAYATLGLARLGRGEWADSARRADGARKAAALFEAAGMAWEALGAWGWACVWDAASSDAEHLGELRRNWAALLAQPDVAAPQTTSVVDQVLARAVLPASLPTVWDATDEEGRLQPWSLDDAWFL